MRLIAGVIGLCCAAIAWSTPSVPAAIAAICFGALALSKGK